jgi:hypothetical protein
MPSIVDAEWRSPAQLANCTVELGANYSGLGPSAIFFAYAFSPTHPGSH